MTIESTPDIVSLMGIEARVWNGVTESGTPCKLFIPTIAVKEPGNPEFDSVLIHKHSDEVPASVREYLERPSSVDQYQATLAKIRNCDVIITVLQEEFPSRVAIQIGLAVLLNKRIIAVLRPGCKCPELLRKIPCDVIELDTNDPAESIGKIEGAIERIAAVKAAV